MPRHHSFGWKKDKPDKRDHIYNPHLIDGLPERAGKGSIWTRIVGFFKSKPSSTAPLGEGVDMRSQDSPIVNQGDLGSCTANSLAGALAFLEIKDGLTDNAFSRLMIYYLERVIEGTVSSDSGAEIRDGVKALTSQGTCYETTWPYDIAQFTVQPPPAAYTEALAHEITQYLSITNLDDMKSCLDAGFPFVFGFTVYESFESEQVAQTGIVPMPGANEQVLGGHAVMALGYDDTSQRFIVRNSWGTSWGAAGYFTIPYAYLDNPDLASDFWTIRRGNDMIKAPIITREFNQA